MSRSEELTEIVRHEGDEPRLEMSEDELEVITRACEVADHEDTALEDRNALNCKIQEINVARVTAAESILQQRQAQLGEEATVYQSQVVEETKKIAAAIRAILRVLRRYPTQEEAEEELDWFPS